MRLVDESKPLAGLNVDDYDALMVIGGQGPMYTFHENDAVHGLIRDFYEAGKPNAVICHATCALLKTRLSDGSLLVHGKTWTGFANSEEDYADEFVGQAISRSGSRRRRRSSTARTSSWPRASSRTQSATGC